MLKAWRNWTLYYTDTVYRGHTITITQASVIASLYAIGLFVDSYSYINNNVTTRNV